jgi:two-component system sensor histidine kinase KdpD
MRANLLRAVSHDLRTPLTSIIGAVTAILESGSSFSPEKQRELLTEARQDAEWLIGWWTTF